MTWKGSAAVSPAAAAAHKHKTKSQKMEETLSLSAIGWCNSQLSLALLTCFFRKPSHQFNRNPTVSYCSHMKV